MISKLPAPNAISPEISHAPFTMTELQSSSTKCPSSSSSSVDLCASPHPDDQATFTLPPLKLESGQAFSFATLIALILDKIKRNAGVGEKSGDGKKAIEMDKARDKNWEMWSAGVRESVEVKMLEMSDTGIPASSNLSHMSSFNKDRQRVEILVKAKAPLRQAVSMFQSTLLDTKATVKPLLQDHIDPNETLSFSSLVLLHFLHTTFAHHHSYDARTRTLLRHLLFVFSLPSCPTLSQLESHLLHTNYDYTSSAQQSQIRVRDANKIARWTKLGLAAVGGGALVGITGGLAAPALAGVLTGWGLGSAVASSGVITAGFTVCVETRLLYIFPIHVTHSMHLVLMTYTLFHFQGYGAMKGAEKMSHRDADVTDFSLQDLRVRFEATATICISGWLESEEDVVRPWALLKENTCLGDVHALRWGTETQLALGHALERFVKGKIVGYAKNEILKRTVLVSLLGALWPLGLLKYGYVIDNPFSNATTLSDKTGIVLADLIISLPSPHRPITLVGYSLGARVIFRCLLELGRRGAFGRIESAILAGAPVTPTYADWRIAASAVSGRLVNAYSRNDWVLGFLYRAASARVGVRIAGLEATGAVFEEGKSENEEEEEEEEEEE
ncbi:hypothetical protein BC937DRAFT_87051, partial [Endogone sp. FLAS-F59071]